MGFIKIDHVNIVVYELDSAVQFFMQLGFTITSHGILEGDWINAVVNLPNVRAEFVALTIPNTQTKLELICYDRPKGTKDSHIGKPNQIGLRHLAIEVIGIERLVNKLKKKGVVFFSDIQVYNVNKKLCYLLGPEGVIIELCEYA